MGILFPMPRLGELSQWPEGLRVPQEVGTALRWLPWSWWWWRHICCQQSLNSQSGSPSWWTSWSWMWSYHSPPRLCCPGCCWPSCRAQTAVVRSAPCLLCQPSLGHRWQISSEGKELRQIWVRLLTARAPSPQSQSALWAYMESVG